MFEKMSSLTEAHIYYIVNSFAQLNSSPESTKKSFDEFFAPASISGTLLLEVAVECMDKIKDLREKLEKTRAECGDVPLAQYQNRIKFLADIAEYCKEEHTFMIGRDGTEPQRADPANAIKAVDTIDRIQFKREMLDLRRKEIESGLVMKSIGSSESSSPPQISMQIIHNDMEEDGAE